MPCLNPPINSDTRFAEPNRLLRVAPRASAAQARADAVREAHDQRPLLLSSPGSVNWRSGGLSDPVDVTAVSDPVWTLDCDQGRVLITNDIEAPRLEHDFDVHSLGWDVIGVPWFDAAAPLHEACAFANVSPEELLSDADGHGMNVRDDLVASRLLLSEPERDELRELGALVGEALGVGIDTWRPGVTTDFAIAGAISEVLETGGAKAVCLIVGGDERLRSFRHPLAIGAVVADAVMAVVVARRAGLHVAATRICVRQGNDDIVTLMKLLDPVNDAVLDASSPGGTWGETLEALADAYEAIGQPGAWREHFQGGPIGFEQREFELAPGQHDSAFWSLSRAANTAVAWNPSLRGGAKIEETYLIGKKLELLSVTPGWPLVEGRDGTPRSAIKVLA
jgi:Xaa-Pro aminopeptidase